MIRTKLLTAATVVMLHCSTANAATISPGTFELFNHPAGALTGSIGPYGLRLDSDTPPVGNGPTFDVEADINPVNLTWNFDNTGVIEGRILNNVTNEFWKVEYNLTGLVATNGGFSAAAGSGTLTFDDIGVAPSSSPLR